ncbi:MAG TPA: zinc-binding dehydrogenase, partial [Myxococcota bacterium]|nr:zinc-binding dehydrogenase [Myxococcota bacterium]
VGYARLGGVQAPVEEPMPIGHELAGTVLALGERVRLPGIEVGTRVALHPGAAGFGLGNGGPEGGFTPRLLVRGAAAGRSLFPIPASMPFEIAALAEPLGVGMNAVDRVDVRPGDRVAVLGAGPIGLSAIATLHDRGIDDVVAVDFSPRRLEVARALGARDAIRPGEIDLWEGLGRLHGRETFYWMDVVGTNVFIEATGAGTLLEEVIRRAAPGARVSVVALHRKPVPVDFMTVLMKQMTLQGAMEYPDRFETMIELLDRRDLSPMITHRFALDDFAAAFDVARSPDAGAKVMVRID